MECPAQGAAPGIGTIKRVGLARRPDPGRAADPHQATLVGPPRFASTPHLSTWPGGQHYRTPWLRARPSPTRGHGGSGRDRHCQVPTPLSGGPEQRPQGDHGPSCASDLRQPLRDPVGRDLAALDDIVGLPSLPDCRVDLNATFDGQPARMERDHSQSPRTPRAVSSTTGLCPRRGRPAAQPRGSVVLPTRPPPQVRGQGERVGSRGDPAGEGGCVGYQSGTARPRDGFLIGKTPAGRLTATDGHERPVSAT